MQYHDDNFGGMQYRDDNFGGMQYCDDNFGGMQCRNDNFWGMQYCDDNFGGMQYRDDNFNQIPILSTKRNFSGRYTNSRQFVGEGVMQLMTIVGSMQLCDNICSNPVLYSRIDS